MKNSLPYAKPLPQPLPGTERGVFQLLPCPLREGGRGVRSDAPPPAPPRNGEGSVSVTPPALSGKGGGGLGRMRKVSYIIVRPRSREKR